MGRSYTPNWEYVQQDVNDPIDPTVMGANFGKLSTAWHDGNTLSSGMGVCGRRNTSGSVTLASGEVWFTYFTAYRGSLSGGILSQVEQRVTGTQGSGLTLARTGLYTVNGGDGSLTLVASTTSDTTGWNVTFTGVAKSWAGGAYTFNVGQRYAIGTIFVGTTPPTLLQAVGSSDFALNAQPPRICGRLTGQSDLPSSVADGSLSTTGGAPYVRLLP